MLISNKSLRSRVLLILSSTLLYISSFSPLQLSGQSEEVKVKIDAYLQQAMGRYNIPGLGVAVVTHDDIIYENYMGLARLEGQVPVGQETLFRVYSTTKLISTVALFQLVEAGKISLEDPISLYLADLPQKWQMVKIKNLLSHSSGLPDFIQFGSALSDDELMAKLSEQNMEFRTGSQFRYNQTNYWLMAQIIEKVSDTTFGRFVLQNQFGDVDNGVAFSSNASDTIVNRATRYFFNNKSRKFEKDTNNNGRRGHAGNGLNITLKRFIAWNRLLDNDVLLNEKTKSQMWTPFQFENEKDEFLHGWGIYRVNAAYSYGFSGGNLSAFRKFPQHNTTIILLSNGYQLPVYDIIVNDIARIAIPDIAAQEVTLESDILETILDGQYASALADFESAKKENPHSQFDNLKWSINSIGNDYLYHQDDEERAFAVFKLNAEANGDWWLSMASLAEMYQLRQDTLKAISTYEKAISLNPTNEWNYNDQMRNEIKKLAFQ